MINLIQNQVIYQHQTLRAAGLDDVDWITKHSFEEFGDSPYASIGFNPAKSRKMLEKFIIEGQQDYLALLSHDNGKPVGAVAAYAFSPVFTDKKVAVEVLLFVEESYRTSRRGIELCDAYEYWAKLIGCEWVQYGHLSSSPPGMISLYEHRGAVQTETVFMKRIAS